MGEKKFPKIFAGIFFAPFLELKVIFPQRGLEYARVSSSRLSRQSSSTAMNCSTVSQSTTRSSPSLEYRKNLRFTGSTTQRVRYSSCIGFVSYLLIIGQSGHGVNRCTGRLMLRFRQENPCHLGNRQCS